MEEQIQEIFKACKNRLKVGKKKYGDNSYRGKNMYEEIRQELYDTINYALLEIIKINRLEEKSTHLYQQ